MATAQAVYSMTFLALLAVGQQRGSPIRMFDEEKPSFPSISVAGTGKVSARPDVADITVGVVTLAPTANAALEANNTAMDRLHQMFTHRGVANRDIRTSQVEIWPVRSQLQPQSQPASNSTAASGGGAASQPGTPDLTPRIVAYRVTNSVQITARQVDKLGALFDAAVQAGANQISGVTFRVEHVRPLLDEARKRAITDAKRKADLLAGQAGMVVGIPWRIEETGGLPSEWPMMQSGEEREMALLARPSLPIAVGEQELSVTVSVVYELKNPR